MKILGAQIHKRMDETAREKLMHFLLFSFNDIYLQQYLMMH